MTREQAEAAVQEYGGIKPAARALHVGRNTLKRALASTSSKRDATDSTPAKHRRRTISERDLLIETDAETRFRANLARELRSLKRGEYIRDFDLRRDVGAAGDASLWREVRKDEAFAGNVMQIGHGSDPAIYWGHADSVADMIRRGKASRPAWAKGA